jgi:hypothetical protein
MNGSLVRNIPAVVEVAQVVFVAAGARGSNVTLVPAAPGTSGLPGASDMPGLVAFTSAQGQPYLCLPDLPRDDLTGLTGPPRRWVELATFRGLRRCPWAMWVAGPGCLGAHAVSQTVVPNISKGWRVGWHNTTNTDGLAIAAFGVEALSRIRVCVWVCTAGVDRLHASRITGPCP